MRTLVPALLVAFFASLWALTSSSESRTALWTCELDAFVVSDASQKIKRRPELDGRGLVSCRNVNGFDLRLPVEAKVKVSRGSPAIPPEQMKLTIDSVPFVVGRDLDQLYDFYTRQTELGNGGAATAGTVAGFVSGITLVGERAGLLLPVRVALPPESAGAGLHVEDLRLDFDSSAPDIN